MCAGTIDRARLVAPVVLPTLLLALCAGCEQLLFTVEEAAPWGRHTIDDRFQGADGVKLGDVNADGLLDLAVSWEQSGAVVVYLHPGPSLATSPWPAVTVGEVGAVEDAVFVDLDADGRLDVVSCCQGNVETMYVHWAPSDVQSLTDSGAWQTEPLPTTTGQQKWMFCEPAQIDGVRGVDLVAGAKGDNGQIGVLLAPTNPRNLWAWIWRPLADATWIMSIIPIDLDADGDVDIAYSDRKGADRGCYWLENPGAGGMFASWRQHRIGTSSAGLMFMDVGDLDDDDHVDVVVATDRRELLHFVPLSNPRSLWLSTPIAWSDTFGTGKSVRLADVDMDDSLDLVFACENAGDRRGIGWLSRPAQTGLPFWNTRPISDTAGGGKFDLIQLLDVDADGDLDVIATEESAGLGVVWYENPTVVR